jgi:ferritin
MKKNVADALNKQMNDEFYSSYLYLGMAAWFAQESLNGFSKWMRMQAEEEKAHAMKIFDYLHLRAERAVLKEVAAPHYGWKVPLEAFSEAAAHERKVTKGIHDLVSLATEEKDFATLEFLHWFVQEQVQEEAAADDIVKKLKGIKSDSGMVYFFDKEMGARTA